MENISVTAYGPNQATARIIPENNAGEYIIDDRTPGQFRMTSRAAVNNQGSYTFPSSLVGVEQGQITEFNADACQANFVGEFNVNGTMSNADINTATVRSVGSNIGIGLGRVLGNTFNVFATEGLWRVAPYTLRFRRTEPDKPEIDSNIRFLAYEYLEESLVCGQSLNLPSFNLDTGTVTINFSVSTGDLLSRPKIVGSCTKKADDGDTLYRYQINTAQSSQVDVQTGSVRIAGLDGDCRLVATANVNGSNTEFGTFNVPVNPGTDVEVDLGAPSLTVNAPEPGICIAEDTIDVDGIVQDDTDVAAVFVNGVEAVLTPMGDMAYAFNITVPLTGGLNEILIRATDTSGNQITDRRTVKQDSAPPALQWLPLDGEVVFQESIDINGTVSDQNDITSLTINGESIMLQSTGIEGEYSFSSVVTLTEGSNIITIIARDSSGCEDTVQVRNITYQLRPEVTGVTRSKGYWSNHPDSIQHVLEQVGSIERCDGISLTSVCEIVQTLKLKGNKNNANARRQSAAAALNCRAFGCSEEIDATDMCSNQLGSELDLFNNSGTHLPFPEGFVSGPANPKYCR